MKMKILRALGLVTPLVFSACSQTHAYPRHPRKVIVRDHHEYVRVAVHGKPYYYHYGHFYWKRPHRYVLVAPPSGISVSMLPARAVHLRYGPTAYYYYEGIYYRSAPEGYVVVPKPDTVYVEKPTESAPE